MHLCGHSSIKFWGCVTLGLRIRFPYLSQPSVSKTCSFINLCIHPSPFWVFEKFHSIHPSGCRHIFSQKPWCFDWWLFPKKSWSLFLFESVLAFLVNQIYFLFCFFYEAFCYLNIRIFLWGILLPYIFKVFLLPKHIHILCEASLLPKHIHTYSKNFCYLNIYIYIFFLWGITTFPICACLFKFLGLWATRRVQPRLKKHRWTK